METTVWDWMPGVWDFFFALDSGAWAAIAAWIAVLVGAITIVVTGRYAKEQIRQTRQQLVDAENDRIAQAESDERARADRERARLEQAELAEQARKEQAEQAKQLREEQAQPNVVLFTELEPTHWHYLELVIKNFGKTPAHNVMILAGPR